MDVSKFVICASLVLFAHCAEQCFAGLPASADPGIRLEFDGKLCRATFANIRAVAQNVELTAGPETKGVIRLSGQVQIESGDMKISADQAGFDFSKKLLVLRGTEGNTVLVHNGKSSLTGTAISIQPETRSIKIDSSSNAK